MNPHHPGHPAAYPHHPSLSSSPHHSGPGGPHHGGYGGGGGGGGGGGNTTTPDLPSPHSPPNHGGQTDPGAPYGPLSGSQGMGSNGHHHGGGGMMGEHPHHPGHPHPHLPGHPAYPPVNHNNNCTLKQEPGAPSGPPSGQICAGCGGRILERWLFHALDRYWHNSCLKCTCCGATLADMGNSCYTKGGMILCKHDYTRMFGGACAACGQLIPSHEFVTRAGGAVFHVKCFSCSKCGQGLVTGDKYFLLSGSPVCEPDWLKMMKSSGAAAAATAGAAAGNGGAPVRKGKVGRPRRSRE